jgi:hypothetical protein
VEIADYGEKSLETVKVNAISLGQGKVEEYLDSDEFFSMTSRAR